MQSESLQVAKNSKKVNTFINKFENLQNHSQNYNQQELQQPQELQKQTLENRYSNIVTAGVHPTQVIQTSTSGGYHLNNPLVQPATSLQVQQQVQPYQPTVTPQQQIPVQPVVQHPVLQVHQTPVIHQNYTSQTLDRASSFAGPILQGTHSFHHQNHTLPLPATASLVGDPFAAHFATQGLHHPQHLIPTTNYLRAGVSLNHHPTSVNFQASGQGYHHPEATHYSNSVINYPSHRPLQRKSSRLSLRSEQQYYHNNSGNHLRDPREPLYPAPPVSDYRTVDDFRDYHHQNHNQQQPIERQNSYLSRESIRDSLVNRELQNYNNNNTPSLVAGSVVSVSHLDSVSQVGAVNTAKSSFRQQYQQHQQKLRRKASENTNYSNLAEENQSKEKVRETVYDVPPKLLPKKSRSFSKSKDKDQQNRKKRKSLFESFEVQQEANDKDNQHSNNDPEVNSNVSDLTRSTKNKSEKVDPPVETSDPQTKLDFPESPNKLKTSQSILDFSELRTHHPSLDLNKNTQQNDESLGNRIRDAKSVPNLDHLIALQEEVYQAIKVEKGKVNLESTTKSNTDQEKEVEQESILI